MGSPTQVSVARVPVSCAPPASHWPPPSAPLVGAPPVSGQLLGSFRPHVRTPAGSARIVPLWLSCSPKPSFLLGRTPKTRYTVCDLQVGPDQHRKGPIQSSELNEQLKRYMSLQPSRKAA